MNRFRPFALALCLIACGSPATAPDTQILVADVDDTDVPPDTLRTLIGVIEKKHDVVFPDGTGKLEVVVTHGRAADKSHGDIRVPGDDARLYLRAITVRVVDAGGYELGASLLGDPTNTGTEDKPIHTRMVQIKRMRSTLFGTEAATLTARVTPLTLEVL